MAVDPTISLNVTGGKTGLADPGAAGGGFGFNPLSAINNFAETQAKLNQNQLFKQTMAARQKLGQIMATSPDPITALKTANADPSVAAFVPDLVQTLSGNQNLIQDYYTKKYTRTKDAFTTGASVIPSIVVDPKAAKTALDSHLANISDEETRDVVRNSMGNIMSAIDDPSLSADQRSLIVTGAAMATGSQDAMARIWAQPAEQDQGGTIQPGLRGSAIPTTIPGQRPGAFNPVGAPVPKSLAPQVANPEGVIVGPRGAPGPSPQSGSAPGPVGGSAQAPAPAPVSMNGDALVPENYTPPKSTSPKDISGNASSAQARSLLKDYTTKDLESYRGAQTGLGALQEMDASLDHLAKDGGFLTPGALGETRLKIANAVNTIAQISGSKAQFDPEKIAKGEDFMKATQRMGPSVLQSLLGQQREAAETIKNMNEKGVPGIDNSYLGGKLMASTLRQAVHRQIDLYNFKGWYAAHNNQDLTGAETEFNRLHPAVGYVDKALAEYGLDRGGFVSPQAVIDQMKKGYLTRDQATKILNEKFPSGPEKKE